METLAPDTSERGLRTRASTFGFEDKLKDDGGYGVYKTPEKQALEKLSMAHDALQKTLDAQTKETGRAISLLKKQDNLLERAKMKLATGARRPVRTGPLALHSWQCNFCANWNEPTRRKCLSCGHLHGSGVSATSAPSAPIKSK